MLPSSILLSIGKNTKKLQCITTCFSFLLQVFLSAKLSYPNLKIKRESIVN